MSTSGGASTVYDKIAAGQSVVFSQASGTFGGWINGQLFLAPYYLPAPITLAQLGVSVTGAGNAGATMTPCFYKADGAGGVGALIGAAAACDCSAVGNPVGAAGFTLPAGWVWGGALPLGIAATAPTLNSIAPLYLPYPTGQVRRWSGSLSATFWFQNGLAAPPANFAGTLGAGIAPILLGNT